jgi:CBS domain-containing protein
MLVREVMSSPVVTVASGADVATCAATMLSEDVGSAVVVDDSVPVGIVTESDALLAALHTGRPLEDISVRAAMSAPLVHIVPTASVRTAAEKMRRESVTKLLVAEDASLRGILTFSDIVWHLSEIRRDARADADAQSAWHHSDRFK